MFRKRGLALVLTTSLICSGLGVSPLEVEAASPPWTGDASEGLTGGTGTATDPFLISSAEDLAFLAQDVNNGNSYAGQYLKLTDDLDLGSVSWVPIGTQVTYFGGIFDGDGHVVKNMHLTNIEDVTDYGLFGTSDGSIVNLSIEDASISFTSMDSSYSVGAFVGTTNGDLGNLSVRNTTIDVSGGRVGGIAGAAQGESSYIEGLLSAVTIQGAVTSQCSIGGIAGYAGSGKISRFYDNSQIELTVKTETSLFPAVGAFGSVHSGYIHDGYVSTDIHLTSNDTGTSVGTVIGTTNGTLDVSRLYIDGSILTSKEVHVGTAFGLTFSGELNLSAIDDNTKVSLTDVSDDALQIWSIIEGVTDGDGLVTTNIHAVNIWENCQCSDPSGIVQVNKVPALASGTVTNTREEDDSWVESGNWTSNGDVPVLASAAPYKNVSVKSHMLYTDSTGSVQDKTPNPETPDYVLTVPAGFTFGYPIEIDATAGILDAIHYDKDLLFDPITSNGVVYKPDLTFTYSVTGADNEVVEIPYVAESENGSLQVVYKFYDTVISDDTLVGEESKSILLDLTPGDAYGNADGAIAPIVDTVTSFEGNDYNFKGFDGSVVIEKQATAKLYVNYVSAVSHNPTYVVERHWFVKDALGSVTERSSDMTTSDSVEVLVGQTVGPTGSGADVVFDANPFPVSGGWSLMDGVDVQTASAPGTQLKFVVNLLRDAKDVTVTVSHEYTYRDIDGDEDSIGVTTMPAVRAGHTIGIDGIEGVTYPIATVPYYEGRTYSVVSYDAPVLITEDSKNVKYVIRYFYSEAPSANIIMSADKESYKNGDTASINLAITNTGSGALDNLPVELTSGGTFVLATGTTAEDNVLTIDSLGVGETVNVRYEYPIPEGSLNGDVHTVTAKISVDGTEYASASVALKVNEVFGSYQIVHEYYVTVDGETNLEATVAEDVVSNVTLGTIVGISGSVAVQVTQKPENGGYTYDNVSFDSTTIRIVEGDLQKFIIRYTRTAVIADGSYQVTHMYYKEVDGELIGEGVYTADVQTARVGYVVGIGTEDVPVNVEILKNNNFSPDDNTYAYTVTEWNNATITEEGIAAITVKYVRHVATGTYNVVHEYYKYTAEDTLESEGVVREEVVTGIPAGTTIGTSEFAGIVIPKVFNYTIDDVEYTYEFMQDSGTTTIIEGANVTLTIQYVRVGEGVIKEPSIDLAVSTLKDSYRRGETVVYNISIINNGTADLNNVNVVASLPGGTWGNALLYGKLDNILTVYYMSPGTVNVTYSYVVPMDAEAGDITFDLVATCDEEVTAEATSTVTIDETPLVESNYKIINEFYTSKLGVEKLVGTTEEVKKAPVGIPTPINAPIEVSYTIPDTEDTYTFQLKSVSSDSVTLIEGEEVTVTCKYVVLLSDVPEGKGAYIISKEFYLIKSDGTQELVGTEGDTDVLEGDLDEVITVIPDTTATFNREIYEFVSMEPESITIKAGVISTIVIKYARQDESGSELLPGEHLTLGFFVDPPSSLTPNEEYALSLKVLNNGTVDLKNVRIEATGDGTWETNGGVVGDLASGKVSETLKFKFTAPEYVDDPEGIWSLEFLGLSDEITEKATDESNYTYVKYVITDFSKADVEMSVTTDSNICKTGDTVVYHVTVENTGAIPLHYLELSSNLEGSWSARTAGDTYTLDRLGIGETWEADYTVTIPEDVKTLNGTFNLDSTEGKRNANAKASKTLQLLVSTGELNSSLVVSTVATAIKPDTDVIFRYTIKNGETFDLTNLKLVVDTEGTWKLNGLTVGSGKEYTAETFASGDTLSLDFVVHATAEGEKTLKVTATTDEDFNSIEEVKYTVLAATQDPGSTTPPGATTEPSATPPAGTETPTPTPTSPPGSGTETPTPTPPAGGTTSPTPTPTPVYSLYLDSYDDYKSSMNPGDVVTINFYVRNDGNTTLHNIQIAQTVSGQVAPGVWEAGNYTVNGNNINIGNLDAGAMVRLTCKITLPTGLAAGTNIDYKYVATANEITSALSNNWNVVEYTYSVGGTTNTNTSGQTNKLTVTSTEDKTSYKLGDTIIYTITVKNEGTAVQEDVTLNCAATGSWTNANNFQVNGQTLTIGNLAAGASVTVQYSVQIPQTISEGSSFINTIAVKSKALPTSSVQAGNQIVVSYKNVNGTLTKVAGTSPKTGDTRELNPIEKAFEFIYSSIF